MKKTVLRGLLGSFSLVLSLYSVQAHAWGVIAHKAIAEIAYQNLNVVAKRKVDKILQGKSLADIATWPDEVRPQKQWHHTAPYHFEDIPDDVDYHQFLQDTPAKTIQKGGVITALIEADESLRDGSASADDLLNYLAFYVHFIGDLHQPLHSGRPEDLGGNKIPMKWHGVDANLHSVWDTLMIYYGHNDLFKDGDQSENYKAYSDYLINQNLKAPDFSIHQTYENWLGESLAIRDQIYAKAKLPEDKYTALFLDTVDQRVYMAGIRLAAKLNEIYSGQEASQEFFNLKDAIETIAGKISSFISLEAE